MSIGKAKEVLKIEAEAILNLIDKLDESFNKAVEVLYNCKGRVVVTGMGKSGLIGGKIAATFASTGTPAFFLHPADGSHGDIGMVVKNDVMLALSNSGETREINDIIPVIKRLGIKLISLTSNPLSALGKQSDIVLNIHVNKEACPLGLAPTASTTAALAMGDALAISLLERRGFKKDNFAFLHPGGTLGKKLILKVNDIMHSDGEVPFVLFNSSVKDAIFEITSKKLGLTIVIDGKKKIKGLITDGDLRRAIEKHPNIMEIKSCEIMTMNPKTIKPDALAVEALQVMEKHSITSLIVSLNGKQADGIIHLHDILKSGVV